ncbi:MAG: hypothetical protein KF715_03395 [Candidatus Didemnitutus sp.]|nr:hypothetical protein [Candidatus Didemnitutus sp.]
MKTVALFAGVRRLCVLPLAVVLLLLAGCLEKNLLWSPDGRRAVVFGQEGLYLTDADGRLSPLLVPGANLAAWLGDSQQLVVARSQRVGSWDEAARHLGAERAGKFAAQVEQLWQKSPAETLAKARLQKVYKAEPAWWQIYLRDRHGPEVRAQLDADTWNAWKTAQVEVHELVMAKIEGDTLVTGAALYAGAGEIEEIRVAAGDRAIACVAKPGLAPEPQENEFQLWVARLGSPSAPELIATRVAAYPDWTADGRDVVYVQANAGAEHDQLRLGTLVQRPVFDAAGAGLKAPEPRELAGFVFSEQARVRCLHDGRILFNAAELSLPVAAEDFGDTREQLFALDPARQATLTRLVPRKHEANLPQSLAFFEVSPDEKQVLFGDFHGAVAVLTLASGDVAQVQEAGKDNLQGQPVWRGAGEFSYTRRVADRAAVRKAEIVLRAADKDRVLSASWPDEMVNRLFSEKK